MIKNKIKKNINAKAFILIFLITSALSITSCATLDAILDEGFIDFLEEDINSGDENEDDDTVDTAILTGIKSIQKASEEITPEMAYYIGRKVALSVTQQYKLYDSPELTDYLNKICTSLALNSDMPYLYKGYFVAILDTDEILALSTPGGHIFISRGLLKCTDSEDAIAAIIAHELSHIQLEHSITAIKTSRITDAAIKTATAVTVVANENSDVPDKYKFSKENIENFSKIGDDIFSTLVNSGFSIAQEYNADKQALNLMINTGYNPNAMTDMLNLLEKNQEGSSSGWSKTHPSPASRKANIAGTLKNYKNKSIDKARIKRFNNYKSIF